MASSEHVDLESFVKGVERRNPGQPEFVQAVHEVAADIFDFIQGKPAYHEYQILRRIAEPDRIISFRVCWEDDKNNIRVQRGWRVQNNNSIGPYKGGIRFDNLLTELGAKRAGEMLMHDAGSGTLPEEVAAQWAVPWVEQNLAASSETA